MKLFGVWYRNGFFAVGAWHTLRRRMTAGIGDRWNERGLITQPLRTHSPAHPSPFRLFFLDVVYYSVYPLAEMCL